MQATKRLLQPIGAFIRREDGASGVEVAVVALLLIVVGWMCLLALRQL